MSSYKDTPWQLLHVLILIEDFRGTPLKIKRMYMYLIALLTFVKLHGLVFLLIFSSTADINIV